MSHQCSPMQVWALQHISVLTLRSVCNNRRPPVNETCKRVKGLLSSFRYPRKYVWLLTSKGRLLITHAFEDHVGELLQCISNEASDRVGSIFGLQCYSHHSESRNPLAKRTANKQVEVTVTYQQLSMILNKTICETHLSKDSSIFHLRQRIRNLLEG